MTKVAVLRGLAKRCNGFLAKRLNFIGNGAQIIIPFRVQYDIKSLYLHPKGYNHYIQYGHTYIIIRKGKAQDVQPHAG